MFEWLRGFNPLEIGFFLVCAAMSITMLIALIWVWITTVFRQQQHGNEQDGAGGQQAAGGGAAQQIARRNGPLIGFFFFTAAALSLPFGYFLPYPWNGMAFTALATAAFFLKLRYRTPDVHDWSGVWTWLTHQRALYARNADNQRRLTGYSYQRLSGFFVAEAFALAFFEAFFRFVMPQYPGVVLAFFLAILYFIATGLAEGIIDAIARRLSWALVVSLVGTVIVITLHIFFFKHIEQRMISVAFIALVMGVLGWYLRTREAQEARNAGLGFLVVSFVAIVAVAANFVSILDKPAQKYINAARAYQNGDDKAEFDGRILPPTKQKPQPAVQYTPPPAAPAATEQQKPQQSAAATGSASMPAPPPYIFSTPLGSRGQPRESERRETASAAGTERSQTAAESPQQEQPEREKIPERIYPPRLDYVFVLAEDPPPRQEPPPAKKRRSIFCPNPSSRAEEIFR